MKHLLSLALAVVLVLFAVMSSACASTDDSAQSVDIVELGSFLRAMTSDEGYLPGPGLSWGMTAEAYIQTMRCPEQLDPLHQRYIPYFTDPPYTIDRRSITPYEPVSFSDINATFRITYSFNENQLYAVGFFVGSSEWANSETEAEAAREVYGPIVVDVLEKLYAHNGETKTKEELTLALQKGHADHWGTRTLFEGEDGTFLAITTHYRYTGITMIVGLNSHVTISPEAPNFKERIDAFVSD